VCSGLEFSTGHSTRRRAICSAVALSISFTASPALRKPHTHTEGLGGATSYAPLLYRFCPVLLHSWFACRSWCLRWCLVHACEHAGCMG
jgi:hypothetical protein